jgi:hypothetical protein
MAHSLFWPTLAVCHFGRRSIGGIALVFAALLALAFTHDGALILGVAILATLLLRARRDGTFVRAAGAFLVVLAIWVVLKIALPPDEYTGSALRRAALHVFDIGILADYVVLLLLATLAGYVGTLLAFRRHALAVLVVAAALVAYWLWLDHSLSADDRYHLRTVLLVATPVLGVLAAASALHRDGRLRCPFVIPSPFTEILTSEAAARTITGVILLVTLVHAVETEKFVRAWSGYKAAVRALATGVASDSRLGDPRFVSSDRIPAELNRLSWYSTTQFLSVLVAPGLAPTRLVVDPKSNYFWLSCKTAKASQDADRAVPVESRELVRVDACLHR